MNVPLGQSPIRGHERRNQGQEPSCGQQRRNGHDRRTPGQALAGLGRTPWRLHLAGLTAERRAVGCTSPWKTVGLTGSGSGAAQRCWGDLALALHSTAATCGRRATCGSRSLESGTIRCRAGEGCGRCRRIRCRGLSTKLRLLWLMVGGLSAKLIHLCP